MQNADVDRKPIVEIDAVSKVYEPGPYWMRFVLRATIPEPITALDGVSFSVSEGEVCAIVGPNGAGKSTLFRVLTGLTTPSTGRASVLDFDCETQSRNVRRHVGFMPADDRSLFLRQTCYENLVFHGRLQGIPRNKLRDRILETLDTVGLGEAVDRAGIALSSGMRARLQLARALLHEPRVLILDEPTGPIDPIGAYELLACVQELTRERRLAVLLSSHRLEEIDALGDNVAFLDRGRVVHWGPLEELRSMWERPRRRIEFKDAAAGDAAYRALAGRSDLEAELNGSELVVTTVAPVGQVLSELGPLVADVVAVEEQTLPLRELLGRLMEPNDG